MTPSLAGDLAVAWRTHPWRQAAAVLAFFAALVALMLLGALHDGLRREADRLAAQLGAGEFAVVAPADAPGWPVHSVRDLSERLAPSLALAGLTAPLEMPLDDGSTAVFVGVAGDPAAARDAPWVPAAPAPHAWRTTAHAAWRSAPPGTPPQHAPSALVLADGTTWRIDGSFVLPAPPPGIPHDALWVPAPALALDASPDAPPAIRLLLARAIPPLAPERARDLLSAALPPSTPAGDCDWLTPETLRRRLARASRTLSWSLALGSAFSLLLAAVTLGALLLLGVRERTREIGLRRALGARPAQIAALFLLEASTLVLVATVAAIPAHLLLLPALRAASGLPLSPTPATMLLPAAVSLAAALLSALPPALRAARLDPAIALRDT